jgi:hypothetical protein
LNHSANAPADKHAREGPLPEGGEFVAVCSHFIGNPASAVGPGDDHRLSDPIFTALPSPTLLLQTASRTSSLVAGCPFTLASRTPAGASEVDETVPQRTAFLIPHP